MVQSKVSVQLLNFFVRNMLTWPVASLGWVSSMVQAEASQKRLNEFLKIEPEKKKNPNKSIINGSISFKNVTLMKIQI
jgi:ATP-binding cassette subfamily B protein